MDFILGTLTNKHLSFCKHDADPSQKQTPAPSQGQGHRHASRSAVRYGHGADGWVALRPWPGEENQSEAYEFDFTRL